LLLTIIVLGGMGVSRHGRRRDADGRVASAPRDLHLSDSAKLAFFIL
jgi:hypothetical protein